MQYKQFFEEIVRKTGVSEEDVRIIVRDYFINLSKLLKDGHNYSQYRILFIKRRRPKKKRPIRRGPRIPAKERDRRSRKRAKKRMLAKKRMERQKANTKKKYEYLSLIKAIQKMESNEYLKNRGQGNRDTDGSAN